MNETVEGRGMNRKAHRTLWPCLLPSTPTSRSEEFAEQVSVKDTNRTISGFSWASKHNEISNAFAVVIVIGVYCKMGNFG